jgi:hypothetical protein
MPQKLPDIPKVDRKTSYQGLKGIVAKLRDEFIRSYLVDSASVTVVDNPGKTRSAEVNFPNQGGGSGVTATITLDGSETVPDGGIFKTFSVALDVPDGTPVAVDTGGQIWPITFVGSYVTGGIAYLHFWSEYGSANFTAGTITVRSVA